MARPKQPGRWVKVDGWKAGRAWRDPDGTLTYHIRRQIDGRMYDVSTRATSLKAAHAQLDRFMSDPGSYQAGGAADPIFLDEKLSASFLAWSAAKGNSPKYLRDERKYLAWWADRLAGVDLRHCSLRDRILPALDRPDGKKCRPQRIATIKVLYSWMRAEQHMIATAEDPTWGQLKIPQARPAQWDHSKVVPVEHVALVIEHLASDRWRDLLRVLCGTGMHVAELQRFAIGGAIEPLPRDGRAEGSAGVLVIPRTKAGDMLRIAVSAEVLAAAKRVREAGSFDAQKLDKAIRAACAVVKRPDGEIGIPPFGPGRLRHTVATLAVNSGAPVAQVSAFLNHKSTRTTSRFYATHGVPAKVPTVL